MELNGGPGDHSARNFLRSLISDEPNITVQIGPLDTYNPGLSIQEQTLVSDIPLDEAIDVLRAAGTWAVGAYGETTYEIFGPNSNTVASGVALFVGAELTKRGYGDELAPVELNIAGIYQPGVVGPEATIPKLPSGLRSYAETYARTLPSTERETVFGTLAEIAANIASSTASAAEKAWSSISSAASKAYNDLSTGIASAWDGFTNAVSRAWDAVTSGVSSLFDPVVVDLDGDGIEISANMTSAFDLDGDGYLEQTAWVGADDGFLVIDLADDGARGPDDGAIDQQREISFAAWTTAKDTDLAALYALERSSTAWGNGDGKLTSADAVWSELRIWRDIDQNGVAESGELRWLAYHDISEVSLRYGDGAAFGDTSDDVTLHGTTVHGVSSMLRNGVRRLESIGDVSLSYETKGWRIVETASGFSVQFEAGGSDAYTTMTGSGSSNRTLSATSNTTGVTGDARGNALDAADASASVILSGQGGADTITGSRFADRVSGGSGIDRIYGGAGDDILFFDVDDAAVRGGTGRDVGVVSDERGVSIDVAEVELEAVYGQKGADTFDAARRTTAVLLFGGANIDDLTGGSRNDVLNGGSGADTLSGQGGDDALHGGTNMDSLYGDAGDDALHGGVGGDRLYGGNDNDILFADAADTVILGGSGYDLVDFTGEQLDLVFELTTNGVEAVIGGRGDDTMLASGAALQPLYVEGDYGDDRFELGAGSDRAFGGFGDDLVFARAGDDRVEGGSGRDRLHGQEGNDRLYGATGGDYFEGGEHNDRIYGEEGDDTLSGGASDDVLFGGSENDQLFGGDHTDQLRGDAGDDVLTGGAGHDRFVFAAGFGSDKITDFAANSDRIEFSGVGTPRRLPDLTLSEIETTNVPGHALGDENTPTAIYSCLTGFTVSTGSNEIGVDVFRIPYAIGPDRPISSASAMNVLDEEVFFFT